MKGKYLCASLCQYYWLNFKSIVLVFPQVVNIVLGLQQIHHTYLLLCRAWWVMIPMYREYRKPYIDILISYIRLVILNSEVYLLVSQDILLKNPNCLVDRHLRWTCLVKKITTLEHEINFFLSCQLKNFIKGVKGVLSADWIVLLIA